MIHSLNGSMLFLYSFECQIIRNGCKRVSSVNALYFMVPPYNKISIYRQLGLMYILGEGVETHGMWSEDHYLFG